MKTNDERMEGYIADISKLLKNWRNIYLSPYGKITVLKSIALSKITHITLIMPELDQNYAKKTWSYIPLD